MIKKWLLFFLMAALMLGGCKKNVNFDDSAEQRAMVEATARHYMDMMKAENIEGVLSVSATPFYLDRKKVVQTPQELRKILEKIFQDKQLETLKVKNVTIFSPKEAQKEAPKLFWKELENQGFTDFDRYVYALMRVANEELRNEEVILILTLNKEGQWKVIGFTD